MADTLPESTGAIHVFQLPPFERAACSAIVQSTPHALVLVDHRLQIVFANRGAAQLFQRPNVRLRGLPLAQVVPPAAVTLLVRSLERGGTRVIETCLNGTRGRSAGRTVKITAVPTAESWAGGLTLLMLEDISDKATLEQQLVDAEKQAAIGQLAAGILHEVSNPLTSLGSNLAFVRTTLGSTADPAIAQALETSLDQVEQMRQLLGTLSAIPGRTAPRYELADVHHVVRQCVSFIAKTAEERHISIVVSFAPALVQCEMDVRLIKQVLLNLLKNAMEAMPGGGRITVTTTQRPASGDEPAAITIAIADTGGGIAEADLRRVFRPLFSTKARGAGLGLSFCRQTVEEHGGEIRVISPGKDRGATALVTLPTRQPFSQDD